MEMIVITDIKTPIVMGVPSNILDFDFKGHRARFDSLNAIFYWKGTATKYRHLRGAPLDALQEAQMESIFQQLAIQEPTQ
jgi:hypothetical protein